MFWPQFRKLGYAVSTLKYTETAHLLYNQACEASEGIIGHRGIRIFCLSVGCMSVCLSVCLSVCCRLSVCLSVIKLLPAYGTDHYQNSYLGSLGYCEDQSIFDIDPNAVLGIFAAGIFGVVFFATDFLL